MKMYSRLLSHYFVASTVLILFDCEFLILFTFVGLSVVSCFILVNSIPILYFEALLGLDTLAQFLSYWKVMSSVNYYLTIQSDPGFIVTDP